jgi:tetratricopeptide (TPR) repeat protein
VTGDRAIEILDVQLVEEPDDANVLYNLACAESRSGRDDAALEHLRRAVELVPRFAELAQSDGDLDGIRGDARFPSPGDR